MVQKTVETINISPIATYANLHCMHCSRVSCCCDDTTKCLNLFLLVLTRGKKFSASLQKLFLPVREAFFFVLKMSGNAMFAFKASLVRFTLRQVGSFVQNYLFTRNPHKNFCCWSYFGLKDLHEFIFARGTIGNKFVSKFKMSLWEKMLILH